MTVAELKSGLTEFQKELLNEIGEAFLAGDNGPSVRALHLKHGKQRTVETLRALGGTYGAPQSLSQVVRECGIGFREALDGECSPDLYEIWPKESGVVRVIRRQLALPFHARFEGAAGHADAARKSAALDVL